MKILLKLFEKCRPMFEEGGQLHFALPLFDAIEHFFFAAAARTQVAPHIRDPLDIKRYMMMVIWGLLPAVLMSWYFYGLRVLAVIIVSYAVGGLIEVAVACIRKEEINEGFLVTGLLFPMVLPPALPLWMVAVGVAFGVLVGKEIFGGTGRNLFNPALLGRCFLMLAYPTAMTSNYVIPKTEFPGRLFTWVGDFFNLDATTSATPLAALKGEGALASLKDLFLGVHASSLGESCTLALLLGGLFLLFTRVSSWRTVVSVLGSYFVMSLVMHMINGDKYPSPLWQLSAGGIMLGALFMATDPVSSPMTRSGRYMYGILIGVVAVLIRNLGGYPEGVMFSILMGNIAAPVFDEIAIKLRLRKLAHEG